MSKKVWAIILGSGLLIFVAAQFIRPTIAHAPVTAELAAPTEVKQILKSSCYDCHSNETQLAWFDQIVPAYWIVASDVKDGRRRLNFSEIGKLSLAQQRAALFEVVDQIQLGAMPLPAYTRLHHSAVVTADQLNVLKNYLNPPAAPSAAASSDLAADDLQYEKWIREGSSSTKVRSSPNGIEFLPDYKNWKTINTTDRFDNNTMRVILGNDTAIKAVAENRTNPWPDGTAFAKVAWFERDNGQGQVRSGAFLQVEFMIRDSRKYAVTKGWGWARWRGADLIPYGKDAVFTEECIGCHAPVRSSDYVFTIPKRLEGNLPWNPMQWSVITSSIDKKASTMSTLYGNDIAVRYARSNSQQEYPHGAVLTLVTWNQQDDARWFGGKIPGQVRSVEFVSVTNDAENKRVYSYEDYEGSQLSKVSSSTGRSSGSRTDFLLLLRAAVMP